MATTEGTEVKTKRRRSPSIRQVDMPSVNLEQALRVPLAISEHYAKQPTRPIDVAVALNMSPNSGPFRTLCSAAVGYGVTSGGPQAKEISLTDLGRRIASPLSEGDDRAAMRRAVLTPAIEQQFLERYNGSPLPSDPIGHNVLEAIGVPPTAAKRVYDTIIANARKVGMIKSIKNREYVDLHDDAPAPSEDVVPDAPTADSGPEFVSGSDAEELDIDDGNENSISDSKTTLRRVFVSTGAEEDIAEQLDQILRFGGLEPVMAQHQSPTSVSEFLGTINEMKSCSSAVIHAERFDVERPPGIDHLQVERQITVKLAAALTLFEDRFVVLAQKGVRLPKELADLHVVHYSADGLGINDMMTIAKALEPNKPPT